MNVLNRLMLRNLKLNRKRTLVTLIGIILSGAMICGVATLMASIQHVFIESAKVTDGSHYVSFYEVPLENSDFFEAHAYTDTAMLSKEIGYAKWDKITNQQKQFLNINAYDTQAFEHFPITLEAGRYPENEHEIVISDSLLKTEEKDYTIGETITVMMGQLIDPASEGLDLTEHNDASSFEESDSREFTITGWIQTPRTEYYDSPYTAYTFLESNTLTSKDTVNISIIGKSAKNVYKIAPTMAEQAQAERVVYNDELLRWMGVTQNDYVKEMMYSVGLIIILLIVIGSVTVIYNAFAISVSERKKQFGMLASVGATQRQILKMVFMEAFVLALIGIPIGILSGILGIGVTLEVVNHISGVMFTSEVPLTLVVSYETILVSILFITVTLFLSAYIPAKRAAKITPIEAIRLTTDIKLKGKKLKTSKLTRMIFGIEGDLALKNLKRNRKRYRTTVFSLFISIVLYVSFSSFITYGLVGSSMYFEELDHDLTIQKYDVTHEERTELYQQIIQLEEIEQYSIQRLLWQTTKLEREQIGSYISDMLNSDGVINQQFLYENEDDTYSFYVDFIAVGEAEFYNLTKQLNLDLADYTNTEAPRGILINHNRVEYPVVSDYKPLHVQAGTSLILSEVEIDENLHHVEPYHFSLKIGAITHELPFAVNYTGIQSVSIIVSNPVFDDILAKQKTDTSFIDSNSRLHLRVTEGTDREKLSEQINQLDSRLQSGPPVHILDYQMGQEEISRTTLIISIFLYGFISLITLIGVTNIFNTISTNVALRRREFAMLKSVGLTPSGFNKMMNYESMFYGLKSLLYGLPVGVLISIWMYNSVSAAFRFSFVLPWKEIGICIAAVFVIVFLTMLHSSSKLKKDNIIDALKEENL